MVKRTSSLQALAAGAFAILAFAMSTSPQTAWENIAAWAGSPAAIVLLLIGLLVVLAAYPIYSALSHLARLRRANEYFGADAGKQLKAIDDMLKG